MIEVVMKRFRDFYCKRVLFCKIVFNILTHPRERKRILEMRRVFRKYKEHMVAVSFVAEKM